MKKNQKNLYLATAERKNHLIASLEQFKGKKVLVIGDVGVDEYVMGDVRRISPEAPVPVLEVNQEELRLGLAANISQNIASLGGIPYTVGVIGSDLGAERLQQLFRKVGISFTDMVVDSSRPTTRKIRILSGPHHIVRVDHELSKYLNEEIEKKVYENAVKLIPQSDIVILQDYAKGIVSKSLTEKIVQACRVNKKRLLVDPHRSKGAEFYHGVDLLKPNFDESVALSGLRFDDLKDNPDKVYEVGMALQKKSGAHEVVITRGKEGMSIFSKDEVTEVPTFARKVFDVTGAGDTVIAAMSLGLASGWSLMDSCLLANFAAGVVVGKVGSVPCELPELIEYINSH